MAHKRLKWLRRVPSPAEVVEYLGDRHRCRSGPLFPDLYIYVDKRKHVPMVP